MKQPTKKKKGKMNTCAANDGEMSVDQDASRNKKEKMEGKKEKKPAAEEGGENTTSCSRAADEEQNIEDQITKLIATGNGMDDRELEARVARLVASADKMDNMGLHASANKVEGDKRKKAPPSRRRGAGCENNGSALDSSRNTEKESREDEPKMVNTVTIIGMDDFERNDVSTALQDMNIMDQDHNDECHIDCMDRSVIEMDGIAERDDDSMTNDEAENDIGEHDYDFSCMGKDDIDRDADTAARDDIDGDDRPCNNGNAIPHCDKDNDKELDDGNVMASPNKSIEEADDENDDVPVAFSGVVPDEDGSVHIAEPSMDEDVQPEHCDVIILGAGAAGIGAARSLLASDPSLKVIVIEARDRPGGRAWTSDELGSGVDLDHGAKLKYRGSGATSNSGKSIIELDPQHTIYDFDAMDSGGDDNDGVSQTSDTFCHDSHKQYRMMWNTEGFLERVKVEARDAKKINSQAGTSTFRSFKMNHIHHEAVQFMYRVICQFIGPESEIDLIKEKLPREATYKDCLDDLACREEPGKTFDKWMYSRTEKVLQFLRKRDNVKDDNDWSWHEADSSNEPRPQPYTVYQVISALALKLHHSCEDYERNKWAGILDKLTCTKKALRSPHAAVGYGQLLKMLATEVPVTSGSSATIDVRYEQQAISVFQSSGEGMEVSTIGIGGGNDCEYIAQVGCICAVPLGVLQQHQNLVFDPPLPDQLSSSLSRLSMFRMTKIEMLFPARWWPNGTGELDVALLSSILHWTRKLIISISMATFHGRSGSLSWMTQQLLFVTQQETSPSK